MTSLHEAVLTGTLGDDTSAQKTVSLELTFPNLRIQEDLIENDHTKYCKAVIPSAQRDVLAMIPQQYSTLATLAALNNHYAISQRLSDCPVLKPIDLISHASRSAILLEWCEMEFVSSDFIKNAISSNPDLTREKLALSIARAVIPAMHSLHKENVVLRDFGTHSFLVSPDLASIRICDLRAATYLKRPLHDHSTLSDAGMNFAFSAPEVFGRGIQELDFRTDYYSLGTIMYQIIAGRLPINGKNPLEFIAAQRSRIPEAINAIDPTVSDKTSALIATLLQKDPDARPGSVEEISDAIQRCLDDNLDHKPIETLTTRSRRRHPSQLIGRNEVLAQVHSRIEALGDHGDSSQIIWVKGAPGIGKTSLIREALEQSNRLDVLFASGKYDQLNRDKPLTGVIQALEALVRIGLGIKDHEPDFTEDLRANLKSGVGALAEHVSNLEELVGPTQPPSPLTGDEAMNRLNNQVATLLKTFSNRRIGSRPIIIFLDDLQWADYGTIQLIRHLSQEDNMGNLMIIGAYRDNEVLQTHPLQIAIDNLKRANTAVTEIELKPLTELDVAKIVSLAIGCDIEQCTVIAGLVYQYSAGNPFFTTRFTGALIDRGLVKHDNETNQWLVDEFNTRKFRKTNNVVEFLIDEIRQLPEASQRVLYVAACLGNRFDLETVSIAAGMGLQASAECLWEPMIQGHIMPDSNLYKFLQPNSHERVRPLHMGSMGYHFLHDRIQQAAYEAIDKGKRSAFHLMIARRLLGQQIGAAPTDDLADTVLDTASNKDIYDIASQYNRANDDCTNIQERITAAKINLAASIRSRKATAYDSAERFLNAAKSFLSQKASANTRELLYKIEAERTEIFLLNGDFNSCERSFHNGLALAEGPLQLGRLHAARVQHLVAENRLEEAIELGFMAINELGFRISDFPNTPEDWPNLLSVSDAVQIKSTEEPHILLAQEIIMCMTPAAFITSFPTYVSLVITMVQLCREFGHSVFAPISYTNYGLVLSATNRIDEGYQASQISLKLLEQFEDTPFQCKVHTLSWGFIRHWKHSNKESQAALLKAFEEGIHSGDAEYAGYAAFLFCDKAFFGDLNLNELLARQQIFHSITQRYGLNFSEKHVQVWMRATEYLMGGSKRSKDADNQSSCLFDSKGYDQSVEFDYLVEVSNHFSLSSGLILKAFLALTYNDIESAFESAVRAQDVKNASVGLLSFSVIAALYPICYMRKYEKTSSTEERRTGLALVKDARSMLEYWGDVGSGFAPVLLDWLNAEEKVFSGDLMGAELDFEAAITQAEKCSSMALQALLAERLSDICRDHNKHQRSIEWRWRAFSCYSTWGAVDKAQSIRSLETEPRRSNLASPDFLKGRNPGGLDLSSVSQSLIDIGRETDLGPLLKKIVSTLSGNLGARHGFGFIRVRQGALFVSRFESDTGRVFLDTDWNNTPDRIASLLHNISKSGDSIYFADRRLEAGEDIKSGDIDERSVYSFALTEGKDYAGAICLCNNLMQDAFSGTSEDIVNLLVTHSTNALNNAVMLKSRELEANAFKSLKDALEETSAPMSVSDIHQNSEEMNDFLTKLTYLIKDTLGIEGVLIDAIPRALGDSIKVQAQTDGFDQCIHRITHPLTFGNELFGSIILGGTERLTLTVQDEAILASFGNLLVRILETNRRMHSDSALRGVFDGMNQGVRVFDKEGRPLVENTKALSISELLVHHDESPLLEDIDSPNLDSYLQAISLAGDRQCSQDDTVAFDLRIHDHNWQRVLYRGLPGGQSVILNSDITAERELEGQLRRADRLSALGTLAGSFAHDFNNFLHVLTGGVEILGQKGVGEKTQERAYGVTQEALNSASELVSKLLLFGRRKSLEQRIVNLRHEIDHLKATAASFAKDNVVFDFHDVPPDLHLRLDIGQFRSALLNVSKNAIEAMPDGGTLSVRVTQGQIPNQDGKAGIKISICDTGKGVADEDKDRLFEPFFSTRLDSGGNGLGLAAVYGFVTKCEGHIDFDSVLGEGTCFHLWFPLPEKSIDINAPIQYAASKDEALQMKLLVVDDLPVLLEVLAMQLSSFGHDVFVAASAEEAMTQLEAHGDFDIMVSDINMPGENGISLMRKCKDRFPNTKVVLISGENDGSIAGTDEAEAILSKPCKAKDLQEILQKIGQGRMVNPDY